MDEYNFKPLNLQISLFAQYVALFVLGLIRLPAPLAYELPHKNGTPLVRIAILMIILWAPMMVVNGAINDDKLFQRRLVLAVSALCALGSFLCMKHVHRPDLSLPPLPQPRGKIAAFLVPNAYTAYLIHAVVNYRTGLCVSGQSLCIHNSSGS